MASIRCRKESGKLYLDFIYQSKRCREQTDLDDTKTNRRRLQRLANRLEAQIAAGTFRYAEMFPNSRRAQEFEVETDDSLSGHPTLAEYAEQWFARSEVAWKRSYRHKCYVPDDSISPRSYPLWCARELLNTVLEEARR